MGQVHFCRCIATNWVSDFGGAFVNAHSVKCLWHVVTFRGPSLARILTHSSLFAGENALLLFICSS